MTFKRTINFTIIKQVHAFVEFDTFSKFDTFVKDY